VYRRRPASYCSEFPVRFVYATQNEGICDEAPRAERREGPGEEHPAFSLIVSGRADGYDPEQALVEEIKTCRVDPARIPAAMTRLHLAQGRLYAAMIAASEDLPELAVQLTWLQLDTDHEYPLRQVYTRAELDEFLCDTLARYSAWLAQVLRRTRSRDASLATLAFPHAQFRAGQRELSERVYKCIHQAGQLLLEAPTGIGKTAAVLYPALKALGTGRHERVVFATTRISGRRAAQQAMVRFSDAGYAGNALSLTAKEQACLAPGKACHGDDCPYARGYYERLPAALSEALGAPELGREALAEIAQRHAVCPYQLSLDLVPWVDVIVADVHHVFSPTANLAEHLTASGGRWTVLLDEAHGLPDRARGMYGADLSKALVMAARREAPPRLRQLLERLNRQLLKLSKLEWSTDTGYWLDQVPEALGNCLGDCIEAVNAEQALDAFVLQSRPALRDLYFSALQWQRLLDCWGDEFRLELVRGVGPQGLHLRVHCLEPSRLLALRHRAMHALVVFSATLSPQQWALDSLGLEASAVAWCAPSPFSSGQLRVQLATHIDTRLQHRHASLPALATLLLTWLDTESGNCLLYFPSYQYLDACLQQMLQLGWPEGRHRWVQGRAPAALVDEGSAGGKSEERVGDLLNLLQQARNVAAFCVLGGAFGEGIDLPGDELCSVVVVSVGLPQLNASNEQLRRLYACRYGNGFDYAYQYPAVQKVSQALGRVVRTGTDRGKALLIDTRYAEPGWRALLPPWWDYSDYSAVGER
jgi:DNA excision repair protein ERCC-2